MSDMPNDMRRFRNFLVASGVVYLLCEAALITSAVHRFTAWALAGILVMILLGSWGYVFSSGLHRRRTRGYWWPR